MKSVNANVGARVCDSLPFSQSGTTAQAVALRAASVDAVAGYLGVINNVRLSYILAAGMAYVPVALAGEYNDGAADELAQLKLLGVPAGVTVWADMEGLVASQTPHAVILDRLNAWSFDITKAGYLAGLYVGVPQPLTSSELYQMPNFKRYWRGQGSIRDRAAHLAEPDCGWCMTQAYPSVAIGGCLVDFNQASEDYRGRLPTWAVS